jgi:predicted Zn-dependent peptidase
MPVPARPIIQSRATCFSSATYQLTTLPNGLRVASECMPYAKSVAIAISVGVGSRHEEKHEKGLSHLLEHMLYKGTRQRSALDIVLAFDAIGAEPNAYTSLDSTVYHARSLPEYTGNVVEILCDILQHSVFDPKELKQEKDAVIEEILGSRDDPETAVSDHFSARAFPKHPLGKSILGTPASVRCFSRKDLKRFMRKHYHPGNIVFSAAGNIRHEDFVQMVQACYAQDTPDPHASANAVSARIFNLARYQGGDKRIRRDLKQTHLILGLPTVSHHSPHYCALEVYAQILGGGMSSRLFQEVREKRGLAYEIEASVTTFEEMGLIEIYSAASPKKTKNLSRVLCEQIAAMAHGVSGDEMTRAKTQLRAQLIMAGEATEAIADYIGEQLLLFGRYESEVETIRKVEAVTAEDVRHIARQIAMGRPTVATLGNADNILPYKAMKAILRQPQRKRG